VPNTEIADLIADRSNGRLEKRFRRGTHRAHDPAQLLAAISDDLPTYGITRVARVTGLDRIGIEVYMISRPNGRGLSVTQGKGYTRDAARLSGIMEAVESWHAERPSVPLRFASRSEMALAAELPKALTQLGVTQADMPLLWAMAIDLGTGGQVAVPFDAVHACFLGQARLKGSTFRVSTNGLASGANPAEAVVHGLCELVERHATNRLGDLAPKDRNRLSLDLGSVDDADAQALLARFDEAGIGVTVWDAADDIEVPSYVACISDLRETTTPPGFGAGCHPSRAVALNRALCEAAQSRLTRISGVRDDLTPKAYGLLERAQARYLAHLNDPDEGAASRPFQAAPDIATDCLARDLWRVVDALAEAGFSQALAVSLSQDSRYSVVRAIVPGLRGLEVEP